MNLDLGELVYQLSQGIDAMCRELNLTSRQRGSAHKCSTWQLRQVSLQRGYHRSSAVRPCKELRG